MKLPRDVERRVLEQAEVGPAVNLPRPEPKDEREFQRQVIDFAHLHGWRVAHFRSVPVAIPGGKIHWQTPVQADGEGFLDLFMVRGTRAIAAELKMPKNKPTKKQLEWFAALAVTPVLPVIWYPADWPTIEQVLSCGT